LLTPDYFSKTVFKVGGLANYISQFLTQFFIFHWIGALIIALLVSGVQIFSFALIKKIANNNAAFVLSFLPSILAFCMLGDIELMPVCLVSLNLGLLSALSILKIKNLLFQKITLLIVGMLNFIFGGTISLALCFLLVIAVDFHQNKISKIQTLIMIFASALIWFFEILIIRIYGDYSLNAYIKGYFYMRDPLLLANGLYLSAGLIVAIVFLSNFIFKIGKNDNKFAIAFSLILIVIGIFQSKKSYDNCEQILEYDCLTRYQKWDEIIKLADKQMPQWVIAQNYLNLALAKTNQLSTKAFNYQPQNSASLYVPFMRHHYMSICTGEVLYYLGLTNSARRYYSEAQGIILNKNLSSRYTMRIAEIDMLNKDYELAKKQLRMLSNTLFYKSWALERLKYCREKIEFDPKSEYSQIQKNIIENDGIEGENNFFLLVELIKKNNDNLLAWDYLLMHNMFERDIQGFIAAFINYAKEHGENLGELYQEGALITWLLSHKSLEGFPYNVSNKKLAVFNQFTAAMDRNPNTAIYSMPANFDKTFWYYLFSKK